MSLASNTAPPACRPITAWRGPAAPPAVATPFERRQRLRAGVTPGDTALHARLP